MLGHAVEARPPSFIQFYNLTGKDCCGVVFVDGLTVRF